MIVHIIFFLLLVSVSAIYKYFRVILVYTAGSSIWNLAIVLSFVMRADLSGGLLLGLFLCVSTCYFCVKERRSVKTA